MSTANTQIVPPVFGALHEGMFDETVQIFIIHTNVCM